MSDKNFGGNNGNTNGSRASNPTSRIRARSHSQQMPCSNSNLEHNYYNTVAVGEVVSGDLRSASSISSANPSLLPSPNTCENLKESHAAAASNYYSKKNNYYCHSFGSGAPSIRSSNLSSESQSQRRSHDILPGQQNCPVSDTECKSDSNWLEEIQFKAQYKHFRSNNYTSVVNSRNSLDNVEGNLDARAHISAPNVSQKEKLPQLPVDENLSVIKDRQGFCWNFPRVQLRKLFNAKSLDDILGRSRKSQPSTSQSHSPHKSLHTGAKERSRLRLESQSNSSLVSSNKLLATSPPTHLSTSSSENNCHTFNITSSITAQPGTTIARSQTNNAFSGSASSAKSKSTSVTALTRVPLINANSNNEGTGSSSIITTILNKASHTGFIKKSKQSSRTPNSRVFCAKSDNCLNRTVASAISCTNKLIRSSVDNIDTAVSREETGPSKKNSLILDVPVSHHNQTEQTSEPNPVTSSQLSTHFVKKHNKVSPNSENQLSLLTLLSLQIATARQNTSPLSPNSMNSSEDRKKLLVANYRESSAVHSPKVMSTNTKQYNINVSNSGRKPLSSKKKAAMEKEKAQLVVANVSYLQRPVSPCRPDPSPTFDLPSASSANAFNNSNYSHYMTKGSQSPNTSRLETTALSTLPTSSYNNSNSAFASRSDNAPGKGANANTNFLPHFDSSHSKQLNLGFRSNKNNISTSKLPPTNLVGGGERLTKILQADTSSFNNRPRDIGVDSCSKTSGSTDRQLGEPNEQIANLQIAETAPHRRITQEEHEINQSQNPIRPHQITQNYNSSSTARGEDKSSWGEPSYYYQFHNFKQEGIPYCCVSELTENLKSSTDEGDKAMDLQSPQYVKRTAHMFNLRYTSQLNESNAAAENIDRNPSYLNVSRSVCGYSCLSYNNGTTAATTKANNSSTTTVVNTPKAPPFPPNIATGIRSDYSMVFKSNSFRGEGDELRDEEHNLNNSSPLPPPLPKSVSPKYVSSVNIGDNSTSSIDGKSFIMQKIERLYGSDAVSSTGFLWKRPSLSSDERIVPISIEGRNHDGNNKSPVWKSQTKEQTLYSTRRFSSSTANQDTNDDSAEPTSAKFYQGPNKLSQNKIPVDKLNKSSDYSMFSQKVTLESNVNNHVLNTREHTHYENGHKAANDSGLGDKDLDSELDKEDNEDFSLIRRNGNFKDFIDSQCTGEPIGVSSAVSLESTTSISPVGSTADDSGLGEGEDRLPFSIKVKPTPKPKPKDMALRRSARNSEKTAAIPSDKEEILQEGEDRTDGEVQKKALVKPAAVTGKLDPIFDSSVRNQEVTDDMVAEENAFTVNKENEDIVVKDGKYFIHEMGKATSQIEVRIMKATEELELDDDPNSDRAGKIRAAIGKANLLIKKKFKQFHELCQANLAEQADKVDSKPFQTKNEDLAGFWDMVYIQVEEIHRMFSDLENKTETEKSDSVAATPVRTISSARKVGSQSAVKSVSKSTIPTKSSAATARDESRRRLLAEKRRALKNQAATPTVTGEEAEVQIFVPEPNQRS